MGDAVQANKAGLLEVADLFVVNKSDRPKAADARRDLELMLDLSDLTGHRRAGSPGRPAIVSTVATTGGGVEELAQAVDDHLEALVSSGSLAVRRQDRRSAEVRSRLDHLLLEVSAAAVASASADGSADREAPGTTAQRLADHLLRGSDYTG